MAVSIVTEIAEEPITKDALRRRGYEKRGIGNILSISQSTVKFKYS